MTDARAGSAWALLMAALLGCPGTIVSSPGDVDAGQTGGEGGGGAGAGGGAAGGAPGDAGQECGSAALVSDFFATQRCLGCHSGTVAPDLRSVSGLVGAASVYRQGQRLVVPGRPGESELWLRVSSAAPAGYSGAWPMPVGATEPPPGAAVIERWIAEGAPTSCAVDAGQAAPVTNPNHLPQDALFACAQPMAPRSSPARLRRIDSLEFSLAVANPVEGLQSNGTVRNNPLVVDGTFSTQSGDRTIDPTTLDLMLLVLPKASEPWTTRAQGKNGGRYWTVYDGTPTSFYSATSPSVRDRDIWVDRLLRQGALFREPTADERARVRALLDDELSRELPGARRKTLETVASAALLMAGSLFRSELGEPGAGPRRRLTDDELALALGRVLGAHPVSSTLWGTMDAGALTSHPDWSRPSETGRLSELRDAAADGGLRDPAVRARLFRRYAGGRDPERIDLLTRDFTVAAHAATLVRRGEYGLSDGLTRFFREWLEVGTATTSFKDEPSLTSAFPASMLVETGFGATQDDLVWLLDDTIARAVIEAELNGQDVFRALMTTRTFRVPSNLDQVDARVCATPADCGDSRAGICYLPMGRCASYGSTEKSRVFGVTSDVPVARDARWVTLPASERSGVLTHPAWLAAHGGNFEDDASLVSRGRWIQEQLLCTDVPGLELVTVPAQLGPRGRQLSARARVKAATEVQGSPCRSCHERMNPYGFPFELYNHAGFVRAVDHAPDGGWAPPDGTTVISNASDPALNRAYRSPTEFIDALAGSTTARRCFIRNVFRSSMGRDETLADACTLADMERAFASGSLFSMMETLVTSDTFVYRHDAVRGQP